MFVLDTNVLSLASPSIREAGRGDRWLRSIAERSYLSAITVGEIQYGVTRLQAKGAHRKAALLSAWLDRVLNDFSERVVSVDVKVAKRAGELWGLASAVGVEPGFRDACIAATADLRGWTVITQNTSHFTALGARFLPPGPTPEGDT